MILIRSIYAFFFWILSVNCLREDSLTYLIDMYEGRVVDLSGASTKCPKLENIPGSYGTYLNDQIIVCGVDGSRNSSCHSLTKPVTPDNEEWTYLATQQQERYDPATIKLSDTEWWITGGYYFRHKDVILNSTEIYTVGSGFKMSIDLPDRRWRHNLIKIDPNQFMLLGGDCEEPATCQTSWMFHRDTELWRPLPDSGMDMAYAVAGLAHLSNGSKVIVAVSGHQKKKTRMFSLQDEAWMDGPAFPFDFNRGSMAQDETTFFVVTSSEAKVVQFDADNVAWTTIDVGHAKGFHQTCNSFLVPENYFSC